MGQHISIELQELRYKLDEASIESSTVFTGQQDLTHELAGASIEPSSAAYEPQIIAIGPLTCHLLDNKTHFGEMQKLKVLYLKRLLQRKGADFKDLQEFLCTRRWVVEKAYLLYAQPILMSQDKFVEMLVLDAFFIVELFHKFRLEQWDNDNNVFKTSWVRKKLRRDLLLAENQLPFFVLREYFVYTAMPEDQKTSFYDLLEDQKTSFYDLVRGFFCNILHVSLWEVPIESPTWHLLGFIHNSVPRNISPARKDNWNFIVCATNLKEAGIKFEKIEGGSLLSIEFDKDAGILKIPRLTIDDDTESFFRNISVYEQFFPIDAYAPFINYVKFMDSLINTAKDVELLCENKILHNFLGDDEVVANMFNRLGDSTFYDVNDYCDRLWNRWIANLRHDYFNTPWAIISVFAALFLLILTLTQTLFSVLPYFQ
ncbi:transmembrane protein [Citrus sinensis]|nr:transmembrane protein [Citrus sinensis]